MKAKGIFSALFLIPLGIMFLALSLLVLLSKGNNPSLIRSKLKFGALLLTFSWFASSCTKPVVTCYAPQITNNYTFIDSINVKSYTNGDTLKVQITNCSYNYYSWSINNLTNPTVIRSGMLLQTDTLTANDLRKFYFILNYSNVGKFNLNIYGETTSAFTGLKEIARFNINLK